MVTAAIIILSILVAILYAIVINQDAKLEGLENDLKALQNTESYR